MTHISRKRRQFLISIIDILLLYISIPIALFLRKFELPELSRIFEHITTFTIVIFVWEVVSYGAGLYSLEHPFSSNQVALKMLFVACISLLSGFAVFYLVFVDTITPKTVMVIFSATGFILQFSWRLFYNYFFGIRKARPNVVFIGYNETVRSLVDEMKKFSYFGFTAAAIYDEKIADGNTCGIPFFTTTDGFFSFVDKNPAEIIILAQDSNYPLELRQYLFSQLEHKTLFFNLSSFFELVTRKVPIGSINDNWLLTNIDSENFTIFEGLKRLFDILISSIILILTFILWPIIAIIIKIESPGPVFFRQIREGRSSKPFSILKFRTMRTTGNSYAPTGNRDSRITPVGNFLRKTRLDEVPQIINVFRGDMSLIGPRPERPELAKDLDKVIPYYRQRLIVKPGITGWDQVSGEYHSPSVEDTYKKLQYDLYYIKNRSIFLDLSIFFKTITTVLKRSGR
jgi:exopolysaccharide biosynthesis polyprenyl glycosylphosphotransferase